MAAQTGEKAVKDLLDKVEKLSVQIAELTQASNMKRALLKKKSSRVPVAKADESLEKDLRSVL